MEGDYDSIASSVSSSSSYRSGDDRTLENKQDVLVRKHDLKQVEMDVPAGNHILVKPRFWHVKVCSDSTRSRRQMDAPITQSTKKHHSTTWDGTSCGTSCFEKASVINGPISGVQDRVVPHGVIPGTALRMANNDVTVKVHNAVNSPRSVARDRGVVPGTVLRMATNEVNYYDANRSFHTLFVTPIPGAPYECSPSDTTHVPIQQWEIYDGYLRGMRREISETREALSRVETERETERNGLLRKIRSLEQQLSSGGGARENQGTS